MVGANQMLPTGIKKFIRLPIEFKRHMAAAVDIGLHLATVTQGKSAAGQASKNHIKGNGQAAVAQIGADLSALRRGR